MNNVIIAKFSKGVYSTTAKVFRYDVGDKLQFVGLDLPDNYRVDFSNSTMGESKTVFCNSDTVEIPPEYFIPGSTIYAWIVLSQDNGRYTKYQVNIPISARAKPLDIEPTPAQKDALDEAIEALNDVTDDIQGDIDAALEEAKASGEFDGTTIWLYDGTPILPDYTFYKYLLRANANAVVRQFDFILLGSILYQIISVSEFTCRAIKFVDLKGDPGKAPIVSVRREGQNYSQIIVDTDDGRQVYNIDNLLAVYFDLWDDWVVHDAPTVSKLGEALNNNCSVLAVVKLPLSPEYGGDSTSQIKVVAPLTYWKRPASEVLADSEILWEFEFKTKIDDDHILRIYKNANVNSKWQYEILEDYTLTEAEKTKLENLKIGSCSATIHNGDNVVIYHPDVEKIREQLSARYDAIFCEVQFTDDMPDDPDGHYESKAKELLSLSTFDHTGPGGYVVGTITNLAFTNTSHALVYSRTEIMGRVQEKWEYRPYSYALDADVVHIDQGAENAGKILGMDEYGHVKPQDPPAGGYVKPSDGIPKTDLASDVQTLLGKADTSLQEHQSLSGYATETWVQQQGYLTQHQDISGKLDKNQGSENSGKVLTVGADGNVAPQDARGVPAGGTFGQVLFKGFGGDYVAAWQDLPKQVKIFDFTVSGNAATGPDWSAVRNALEDDTPAIAKIDFDGEYVYLPCTFYEPSAAGHTFTIQFSGTVGDALVYTTITNGTTENTWLFYQWSITENIEGAMNVFFATYGTTTSAEINAAVQAGKAVYCVYDNDGEDDILPLVGVESSEDHVFGCVYYTSVLLAYCNSNQWEYSSFVIGKYTKPSDGIPKTDLAAAVQTSLEKADTALQQHQDISGKLDKSQGTAHAGEFLVVGSDGNVTTKTMSAWQGGAY